MIIYYEQVHDEGFIIDEENIPLRRGVTSGRSRKLRQAG